MKNGYEMRVRDLWDVMQRRRRMIAGAIVIGLGLGLAAALLRPTMYRASSTITLDKVPPVVVLSQPGFVSTPQESSPAEDITVFPDVPGLVDLANGEPVKQAVHAKLDPVLGESTASAALTRLRVKQVRQSPLLEITVAHPNRAVATTTANTVATVLVQMDLQSRRGRATELRQAIEQQLQAAIPKLSDSEDALSAFKSRHGDVSLASQTTLSVNRLATLETQLADVRMQQQETHARIQAAQSRLASVSRVAPTTWAPSPLITTLQNQLATEQIELSGMRQLFTPKYPGILAAQMKIQETKARLDAELARSVQANQYGLDPVYQQLLTQLRQDQVANAAYGAREQALGEAIKAYDYEMRQLPSRELEQVRLTRAAKQAEEVTQILSEKLQQARIAEASVGSAIRVVDPARLPANPIRGRWLNLVFGAVVGLTIGLGGAFAKERLDDPLKSSDDAASVLQLPVLASVPRLMPRDIQPGTRGESRWLDPAAVSEVLAGLTSGSAGGAAQMRRARFAETFRYLRTNLMAQQIMTVSGPRTWRTLLVTSPGPGDGKNSVAANLAIALAQTGRRVWLVDCDLRRPAVDSVLAFQDPAAASGPGMAEFLERGAPMRPLARPTVVPNLSVLPAGTARGNPAEWLASQRMRDFLSGSHAGIDVLIAVAPPVLPVADASVLAPLVDGVILVVHAGLTPREAALKALEQLKTVGARLIGAVVVGAPVGGPGGYDDYYYYADYYQADPGSAWYFGADMPYRVRPNAPVSGSARQASSDLPASSGGSASGEPGGAGRTAH